MSSYCHVGFYLDGETPFQIEILNALKKTLKAQIVKQVDNDVMENLHSLKCAIDSITKTIAEVTNDANDAKEAKEKLKLAEASA